MNAIVTRHPSAPTSYTGAQLDLIRRTVAADCNAAEFDLFIEVARRAGLDPFRRQIMAVVFNKNNAEKRRMTLITGIDGLRAIADRSGQYRPDEDEPDFTYDLETKGPNNPLGLLRAKVRIWKGDKPVTGIAYWDEYAPLKEVWEENPQTGRREKSGRYELDASGQWPKMGRTMLAKCAEANALRKAFPEDTSGLYEGAEVDRATAIEMTASEVIGEFTAQERLARIGGPGITVQLAPNQPLETIPVGQFADRVAGAVEGFGGLRMLDWFESANTQPLREFWAHNPSDALELKKLIEKTRAGLAKAEEADTQVSPGKDTERANNPPVVA